MKTLKKLVMLAVMALLGVSVTSCGGYSNSKAKDMIAKDDDGKLEQSDYTDMIQWVEDANKDFCDGWEEVIKDNPEYKDYELAIKEFTVNKAVDYVFIGDIEYILNKQSRNEESFGKENVDRWKAVKQRNFDRRAALNGKTPKEK